MFERRKAVAVSELFGTVTARNARLHLRGASEDSGHAVLPIRFHPNAVTS